MLDVYQTRPTIAINDDFSQRFLLDVARGAQADNDPSRSGDGASRSTTAYASRHQAAEQRRRTRINERLDLLRKMVPHTERSNTASFLEEVLKYIDSLKSRVVELELALQAAHANAARPGTSSVVSLTSDVLQSNRGGGATVLKQPDSPMRSLQLFQDHLVNLPQQNSVNPQNIMNLGYTLQQLQQQQLQQLQQRQQQMQLQQQHEAALAALREEQQQQAAAIMAIQQLRQQQELAASRQSNQLATLANRLGLKTLDLEGNKLTRPNQQMMVSTLKSEGNSLLGHSSNIMHGLEALIMGQQHRLAVSSGNAGPSSSNMSLQLTPLLPLQIPSSALVETSRSATANQSGNNLLLSPPQNPNPGTAGSGNAASAETHAEEAGSLPRQQPQESSSGATASAEPADASPTRKRRALIL
ncbi:hypothetical protein CEUSTIGMA_g6816.t1 [Chlamydomonas eustigma]|uniref:BHLH domain-containing protein n=1 Tax=Chlamydomonas eustigma TaxID=1157962 RepID=A0A250X8H3_9CHLO|nr:hypothetical protein CEUSTIGMA_g6816.t1 [Chlamydomonas eustigma]|eukprot:GAX79374.1 hypothetical protein CEUSTIGMA_g6816.t1 [Chlamydomonas eustigma]